MSSRRRRGSSGPCSTTTTGSSRPRSSRRGGSDPAGREALREALAAVLEGRPRLFFREDPSLLGGFAVRSGNRIFDASARGELERFLAAHAADAR